MLRARSLRARTGLGFGLAPYVDECPYCVDRARVRSTLAAGKREAKERRCAALPPSVTRVEISAYFVSRGFGGVPHKCLLGESEANGIEAPQAFVLKIWRGLWLM